jgi:phthiodiolone/phenolphthiodiolone dimycocerosates ketoreductase
MPLAARRPDSDAFLDPFCVCAALGPTTDLPLGLAVTDGIRRGAPDVARSALTLQQMCKGGFNLGIGSGEAEIFRAAVHHATGCVGATNSAEMVTSLGVAR